MATDDRHLLNQLKQSALDAFQCLFEKYQLLLFKYLYYRTKDESLSQDIIQETFLKVWLKRATIKANVSFWAYLVKISENLIKDHYKRKEVREKHQHSIGAVHESVYDNPEAAYHFNALQREIMNSLRREGISKSAASANNGSALKVARTTGATKVITGLASRMDDVYIITLTLSDVNSGKTRQMTKNCKGNFNRFLSTSVKEAVAGILKNI